MPYSPSPRPGPVATGSLNHILRHSETPPLPPQAVSKQKKRRNALAERLEDISVNFTQNRDDNYRKQLQTLQFDTNYINSAQPYENAPLEDLSTDIHNEMIAAMIGNSNEAHRSSTAGVRIPEMEVPPRAGMWASNYIQEINDSMEERDTQLTLVAERHNSTIGSLKAEYEYSLQVAEEERKILREQIRERIIHQVQQKRALLLKEKNAFLSDTNALHLNHNGYSLGNAASPGGPHSNRKTRNTRQKLEVDDLGVGADGSKRKRKSAADADSGSPGASGRNTLADTSAIWKEFQAKTEPHQTSTPSMSIEQLFSEKELLINLQVASHAAIDAIARRRKLSNGSHDSGTLSNGEVTDAEDNGAEDDTNASPTKNSAKPPEADAEDSFLAAPEMDRTANSSYYATRSARVAGLNIPLADSSLPSDLAGRASVIPLLGTFGADRFKKEDEPHRTTPLTDQEKDADLAMITAALKEQERNPGSIARMNRKALKDVCPPVTDYVSAAIVGRGEHLSVSNMRTEISPQSHAPDEALNLEGTADG